MEDIHEGAGVLDRVGGPEGDLGYRMGFSNLEGALGSRKRFRALEGVRRSVRGSGVQEGAGV